MALQRSYARRRLRKAFRAFAREAWQILLVFALATAVLVLCAVIEPSAFVRGLLIGAGPPVLASAFGLFFLMHDGNYLWLAGAWAEDYTNDELGKARKAGNIWGWVQNIEIGGFDIDHLVVAPGGVFAVETKSHSSHLSAGRATAERLQAQNASRKAGSVLRSVAVQMPHDVTPVLAVAGKRATKTIPAEGCFVEGVHVVAVHHLVSWFSQHGTGRLSKDRAEELLSRVRTFKSSQVLRDPSLD